MRRPAAGDFAVAMTDERQDNYAGVFDGGLGFGRKSALILVDFVEAYFDKG